ncbi:hypothetical protein C8F04DRAFT_1278256 [Mycena alexandri]|uniref:Uncharacterized protein n=1 Tax=Mycena alexandri TaxID=1745969 RepID=A0AAD6WL62_9AGAR|nr:hypothetical protein C8F04DRAFT_1278256 [Mycena alexandri]
MAPAAKNKTPAEKASSCLLFQTPAMAAWTLVDDRALLVFLVDEKAAAGDNGQFKAPTTARHCSCFEFDSHRKFWALVDLIINTSGGHGLTNTGLLSTLPRRVLGTRSSKQYPDAARFKNEGWAYYELMAPLMPTKAKGGNVFRTNIPAALPRLSSPDDEDKDDEPRSPASSGAADDNEDEEKGEESDVFSSPITPKKDRANRPLSCAPSSQEAACFLQVPRVLFRHRKGPPKNSTASSRIFITSSAQPQPAPAATGVASMSTITALPAATLPPSAFQTSPQTSDQRDWWGRRTRHGSPIVNDVALVRVLTVPEKAEGVQCAAHR